MTSELFLDTNVAIDRIFDTDIYEELEMKLNHGTVITISTYVLMEFKRTVLNDCIYLHSMVEEEESLNDVYWRLKDMLDSCEDEHIADRCIMFLKNFGFPNTDKEKILKQLKWYIKSLLIKGFLNGLNLIESDTKCTIAQNKPKKSDRNKYRLDLDCNGSNRCEIEEYIHNHSEEFKQILKNIYDLPKLKYISEGINVLLTKPERARDGCCKRIGDAIVAIDAPSTSTILSSNEDLKYICPAIGKELNFFEK